MKLRSVRERRLNLVRDPRLHGFLLRPSLARAWRSLTAPSSTSRYRRYKRISTLPLSTFNGSSKPTHCCSRPCCSWEAPSEITMVAAEFSLLALSFFLLPPPGVDLPQAFPN